ncbi:hypothetical protein PROFUN_16442 [Planoprotostelium fungivorum]|uniref:Uncharacterized protein n=1 Tax=Planoprotostelium fungivorum TaxID=1890364 RepID=A0A2P6MQ23_9EUKA|nr:hypothetical protein PROFUN_16442 [Planoprotostelium fungivorum]
MFEKQPSSPDALAERIWRREVLQDEKVQDETGQGDEELYSTIKKDQIQCRILANLSDTAAVAGQYNAGRSCCCSGMREEYQALTAQYGVYFYFIPTYSPELNATKLLFACLKGKIRGI